jgi:hypothetical protein
MRERKKTRGMLLIGGNTVREMGSLGVENTGNAILILCRRATMSKEAQIQQVHSQSIRSGQTTAPA